MSSRTALFLLAASIPSLQGGSSLSAHPLPSPSAPQGTPRVGQASSPTVSPRPVPALKTLLFADGSVSCNGANDMSQPVGVVTLAPQAGGTAFRVQLGLGASMANWPYDVELSLDGSCQRALRFPFALDGHGGGVFTGFYPAPSGPQTVLVDVVSAAPFPPPDPKLREIAPLGLMPIAVPDDGTTVLVLGFAGGSRPLPWSEQGFTFTGEGTVSGGHLSMEVSSSGFPVSSEVRLSRSSGDTFDALALDADLLGGLANAEAWVTSDLGGYQELWGGSTVLEGPLWEGITELRIHLGLYGDDAVEMDVDDIMIRIH